MPIYEYHCKSCGQDFELMRRLGQMDAATKCVHCASKETKRKLSVFAPVRSAVTAGDHEDHEDGDGHAHDDGGLDLDCC